MGCVFTSPKMMAQNTAFNKNNHASPTQLLRLFCFDFKSYGLSPETIREAKGRTASISTLGWRELTQGGAELPGPPGSPVPPPRAGSSPRGQAHPGAFSPRLGGA